MLDRPWLETPFVFQGFEIKDQSEIAQLQRYCKYVYVDGQRGHLTKAQIVAMNNSRSSDPFRNNPNVRRATSRDDGWLTRFRSGAAKLGLGGFVAGRSPTESGGYRSSETVRSEAPKSKAAYELNLSRYQLIIDMARNHGEVKIDTVTAAVTPTIESVLRNPDAMAWSVFSRKRSGQDYSRAVATSVWCVMFGRPAAWYWISAMSACTRTS